MAQLEDLWKTLVAEHTERAWYALVEAISKLDANGKRDAHVNALVQYALDNGMVRPNEIVADGTLSELLDSLNSSAQ